ncbi:hypothetical protein O4160_25640 [Rhodococcus sp. IEGM 1401]|uniref:hypothetical protein n=1 Tax=unclassified Rhodococcus (in: high G+C Gram-positive bacteria) TaxID=192944 RepID=UPI001FB23D1D|nr:MULTISPECIES: hypothetical protein [unclassified Rhodococcus (in: high G+C Gram-positive bacteria)]MCJ0980971.1 hypothetical protein [Rhodococcus sp. ARC_M12]MCZ4564224.1 hypothetical protein [Rhodococcus sp. IEGM 1401]MDI9924354.1 hypothetical protein [Rhodococcus sp. IEGM 1372]MDV8036801.1 hypothetical protein [Rhodococcus sp. IEGM 1414]
MRDIEDEYLSLIDVVADRSEYAVAKRGKRYDFNTAEWTVSVIAAAISGLAGGMLSALGGDLAEASIRLVRKIANRDRTEPTSTQQLQDLETLHRIVIEVRGPGLPNSIDSEVVRVLKEAGLDDEAAQTVCRRLRSIVEGKQEDNEPPPT